ncbi:vanadium-dependent haloperoxidase, partial [Winogradskyella sp.]
WDCNPFVSVNKGHFMFAAKKITPGAHWIGICKIACKNTNSDFGKTVYAYTKTSIAVADSFISCWDEKYRSNLIRPETLINKYIDTEWAPVLQTPPFPEYTSGHSVVSGASSEVLTAIFGDNFAFDDTTELPYGLPMRSFKSFRLAAQEAAISRLYGSIHYRAAIKVGLDQGIKLGTLVNNKISFLK